MQILHRPSPHFRKVRRAKIDSLVIHFISAVNINKSDPFNVPECLKLLTEPIHYKYKGRPKVTKLSAHYVLARNGMIYQLVDDDCEAWHAGFSKLHGRAIRKSCNAFSIGIELIGGLFAEYTEEQYESLIKLCKKLVEQYNIPKANVVGHDQIATPAGRKVDPGKHFNWDLLLDSLYPKLAPLEKDPVVIKEFEKEIHKIKAGHVPVVNDITSGQEPTLWETILEFIQNLFKEKSRKI